MTIMKFDVDYLMLLRKLLWRVCLVTADHCRLLQTNVFSY